MSNLRLGVDISNGETLAALVESVDANPHIVSLERFSPGEMLPDSFGPGCAPTIAIPDRHTIVRAVQTVPVSEEMAEKAARFELTSSLLEPEAEFKTLARPISTKGKRTDTPDRWLTAAVRRSRLDETERCLFGESRPPNTAQFTTRSIALGVGFLNFCESSAGPSVVVVSPSANSTAVCFLSGGYVIGVAGLRGLPSYQNNSGGNAGWLSELQTLVQFRKGTDLALHYPVAKLSLFFATDDDIAIQLAGLSSIPITPAVLKSSYRTASVDGTPVSLSWLVALGAAVN